MPLSFRACRKENPAAFPHGSGRKTDMSTHVNRFINGNPGLCKALSVVALSSLLYALTVALSALAGALAISGQAEPTALPIAIVVLTVLFHVTSASAGETIIDSLLATLIVIAVIAVFAALVMTLVLLFTADHELAGAALLAALALLSGFISDQLGF